MLRRFLHFDSFLTSDFKKPTGFTFIYNESYPEDALKINVKHVGFLKTSVIVVLELMIHLKTFR